MADIIDSHATTGAMETVSVRAVPVQILSYQSISYMKSADAVYSMQSKDEWSIDKTFCRSQA